jgi:hypothetical protein
MEKCVTLNELIKQLEIMKNLGYGEAEMWFMKQDGDEEITRGIWTNIEENGKKIVWLG